MCGYGKEDMEKEGNPGVLTPEIKVYICTASYRGRSGGQRYTTVPCRSGY